MNKLKPCKGIGKAKTFSGCGEPHNPFRFGLCFKCFPKWLYNTEEGQEMIIKISAGAKKKVSTEVKKKANKEKKERRFELLTYAQRIQEARKVFQKWIRERDKDLLCVSCQNPFANDYHAGHFKKAEIYSQLIFNENNCWKQCVKCNTFLNGNEANYRVELVKRIGLKAVEELESAIPNRVFKYSNEELKAIIKKYSLK